MMDEMRRLCDEYADWLKERTTLREVDDWVEITTPYLDRHNDCLQIYARKDNNGGFRLTDDGYIIRDLQHSGCSLDTPKRQALLTLTLNGFGVQRDGDQLTVLTSSSDFAQKKHNLLQAMIAVNDLFFLARPITSGLFFEDVVLWLSEKDIRYTPKVKFTGQSGYDHVFDFVIPQSRMQPERLLRAISNPTRQMAQACAFAWIDIKDTRPPDSKAYAVLNDAAGVSGTVVEALNQYAVRVIVWSAREQFAEELAA